MKYRAMVCRALSGHAWEVEGRIYVVKGDARRITFHCARCDSWRSDTWTSNGKVIQTRYYKRSQEYAAFIKDHDRGEARGALLGTQKEHIHGTKKPRLRLVRGTPKGFRRHPRADQRARDKKRA